MTKQFYEVEQPALTEEQIEAGFHIWREFKVIKKTSTIVKNGELELKHEWGTDFEHYKKCPCGKDVRLK